MGIKGLTQLVKKNSPESITHIGLYKMKDKRIAIDTSIFLYKSLMNVRSKGDYLRNNEDPVGKDIIHGLDNLQKDNRKELFVVHRNAKRRWCSKENKWIIV